jgi:hypothetical protein
MTAPLPTENARDIKARLSEMRLHEVELSGQCDCAPEDTENHKYAGWLQEAADHIASLERALADQQAVTDAVGGMIKATGRYHTAQWYVNLVAVYDEYLKGKK